MKILSKEIIERTKRAEATSAFALAYYYGLLISVSIVLYYHRKSGHHFGTKTVKIIVAFSPLIGERPGFAMIFTSQDFLMSENQILFFTAKWYSE